MAELNPRARLNEHGRMEFQNDRSNETIVAELNPREIKLGCSN